MYKWGILFTNYFTIFSEEATVKDSLLLGYMPINKQNNIRQDSLDIFQLTLLASIIGRVLNFQPQGCQFKSRTQKVIKVLRVQQHMGI